MTDGRSVVGLAHCGVVVGGDGFADALVALNERLLIYLRGESAVGNLVEVIDVKPVAAHADVIHAHEGQLAHSPLGLLHDVGRDVVDVALAEACIAVEMLHVASLLEPGGRYKHRELLRLELLELFGGKVCLDGLAVVGGALAQHLVVLDLVIHFMECDVVVYQCTETIGIHGNLGSIHNFNL